jgi:hypothetical protein
VLAARLPDHDPLTRAEQVGAFHDVFLASAGMALIGAFASLAIRDADAASTMRKPTSADSMAA